MEHVSSGHCMNRSLYISSGACLSWSCLCVCGLAMACVECVVSQCQHFVFTKCLLFGMLLPVLPATCEIMHFTWADTVFIPNLLIGKCEQLHVHRHRL